MYRVRVRQYGVQWPTPNHDFSDLIVPIRVRRGVHIGEVRDTLDMLIRGTVHSFGTELSNQEGEERG